MGEMAIYPATSLEAEEIVRRAVADPWFAERLSVRTCRWLSRNNETCDCADKWNGAQFLAAITSLMADGRVEITIK
jgi:hypothetical protein